MYNIMAHSASFTRAAFDRSSDTMLMPAKMPDYDDDCLQWSLLYG
jgi:hypothetical protein